MTEREDVTWQPTRHPLRWSFGGIGLTAAGVVVWGVLGRGSGPVLSERATVLCATVATTLVVVGLAVLYAVTARVSADASGLRTRTVLRRRYASWRDVADLRIRTQQVRRGGWTELRRVSVRQRDGRVWRLPLLYGEARDDPDFDATVEALRVLHRAHGQPDVDHLAVVTHRTAGRGWVVPLGLCVLLLAFAGLAASSVSATASQAQAWRSAVPCTAGTPTEERGDCLTVVPAEIARTEVRDRPSRSERSWLYLTDGRPVTRLAVSDEAAQRFRRGGRVDLTIWRGEVYEVSGAGYVWRRHVTPAGDVAVAAAACALAAGYPGALVLLRFRARRRPDDEVLPSVRPFLGALAATAAWLLPLCYLHPVTLPTSPVAVAWGAAGLLVTLGLLARAWRATRVRAPTGIPTAERSVAPGEEVFLPARFLEPTDYNPYGFGTHVVLGGDGPAVTPHAGPGRWAARRIPVDRLAVTDVRRVRGGDGGGVPRHWHVAELDDAGTPVRLAAAPDDLALLIRTLGL